MTYDELCNYYLELSQKISALHTHVKAAKNAYDLIPNDANLAALHEAQHNLSITYEHRDTIEQLLQQHNKY